MFPRPKAGRIRNCKLTESYKLKRGCVGQKGSSPHKTQRSRNEKTSWQGPPRALTSEGLTQLLEMSGSLVRCVSESPSLAPIPGVGQVEAGPLLGWPSQRSLAGRAKEQVQREIHWGKAANEASRSPRAKQRVQRQTSNACKAESCSCGMTVGL